MMCTSIFPFIWWATPPKSSNCVGLNGFSFLDCLNTPPNALVSLVKMEGKLQYVDGEEKIDH